MNVKADKRYIYWPGRYFGPRYKDERGWVLVWSRYHGYTVYRASCQANVRWWWDSGLRYCRAIQGNELTEHQSCIPTCPSVAEVSDT